MKRTFILSCLLVLLAGIAFAGPWSNYEDYQSYLDVRKEAKDAEAASDTVNAVANWMKAEVFAEKSADDTIKGWPLNNAAYVLISVFKTAVGYSEKLAKLEGMSPSKEKIEYQKELANLFNLQLPLLEEAKSILEKAKGLGEEVAAAKTVQSNLDFISWVIDFTSENLKDYDKEANAPVQEATETIIKPVVPK